MKIEAELTHKGNKWWESISILSSTFVCSVKKKKVIILYYWGAERFQRADVSKELTVQSKDPNHSFGLGALTQILSLVFSQFSVFW